MGLEILTCRNSELLLFSDESSECEILSAPRAAKTGPFGFIPHRDKAATRQSAELNMAVRRAGFF